MSDFARFSSIIAPVIAALKGGDTSTLVFLPDDDIADVAEASAKALFLSQDGVLTPSLGGRAGALAAAGLDRPTAETLLGLLQSKLDADIMARKGQLVATATDKQSGRTYGSLPRLYYCHRALAAALLLTE